MPGKAQADVFYAGIKERRYFKNVGKGGGGDPKTGWVWGFVPIVRGRRPSLRRCRDARKMGGGRGGEKKKQSVPTKFLTKMKKGNPGHGNSKMVQIAPVTAGQIFIQTVQPGPRNMENGNFVGEWAITNP